MPVDPWGGFNRGVNALRNAAALNQTDRRTNIMENQDRRAEQMQPIRMQEAKMRMAELQFHRFQNKIAFAGKIIPKTTKKNYKNVYNAMQKLFDGDPTQDFINSQLLPPEQALNLSDEDFDKYITALKDGADDISASKDLAEFKNKLQMGLAEKKSELEKSKMERTAELEKTKHGYKMAEIEAKSKGEPEKESSLLKDIRNRYQSVKSELRRLQSGVDIIPGLPEDKRMEAIADAQKELESVAMAYKNNGGNLSDLGAEEPPMPVSSTKTMPKKRYVRRNGKLELVEETPRLGQMH